MLLLLLQGVFFLNTVYISNESDQCVKNAVYRGKCRTAVFVRFYRPGTPLVTYGNSRCTKPVKKTPVHSRIMTFTGYNVDPRFSSHLTVKTDDIGQKTKNRVAQK